jgi:hypothetical protein
VATSFGARKIGANKLVFSEAEYLKVATTMHSWQGTVFLDGALFSSIVFIGVSLSDSNMRRWLSWAQRTRTEDIGEFVGKDIDSSRYFWLKKSSGTEDIDRWVEASVATLGVRLVWLDRWEDTTPTLKKMLGLK